MELKTKFLSWSTGVPVILLEEETAKKLGARINERVSIKTLSRKSKEFFTVVNIAKNMLKKDQIGVSSEVKKELSLKSGQKIDVSLASLPKSLIYIKKKSGGLSLSRKEIKAIINDVVTNSLSEAEIALFISAMHKKGMDMQETIYLIKSIRESGSSLNLKNRFIVDKHSIGGIPGNRTTPIVVSICASVQGIIFPKTSSRAITSAAGTADTMESIARVDFSMREVKEIVRKTGACLVWGGGLGMVPADSKIIKVEKKLNIDPESQLLASIMSKKLAVGSKFILIDIPYGKNAKVTKNMALKLKKKFEYLGKYFNKKIKCVLSQGDQPIGNGIGPVLEMRDIISILDPEKKGPLDLEKKSLSLAGEILELTGKAKKGKGILLSRQILYSGKAFEKFKEIVDAQKGSFSRLKEARYKKEILSNKELKLADIDNSRINSLAKIAGAPKDKSAGVYLHFKKGQKIGKGEKILTIYSESRSRINQSMRFYKQKNPLLLK